MPRWLAGPVALLYFLVQLSIGSADAADKRVTIGFLATYTPWIVGIASGAYERATGYEIEWREYATGFEALSALAKGEVQIAYAGVTPIAGAVSNGLPLEVFWMVGDINQSEALVVRAGAGIVKPRDLRNKRIATPFGSTSHFHLLFALEQFGIPRGETTIVSLTPSEIPAAWQEGRIDGAYIWEPVQSDLLRDGKVLIHSGDLSAWGRPTFDALVADPNWSSANPDFMVAFIKTIAVYDDSYRKDRDRWTRASANVQDLVAIVGGTHARAVRTLGLYSYPSIQRQASTRWLSGGSKGGVAQALAGNAQFLFDQGVTKKLAGDYSFYVNSEWVRRARTSN